MTEITDLKVENNDIITTMEGFNVGDYVKFVLDFKYFDIAKIVWMGYIPQISRKICFGVQFLNKKLEKRKIKDKIIYKNRLFNSYVDLETYDVNSEPALFKCDKIGYESIALSNEIKKKPIIWSDMMEQKCYKLKKFNYVYFKKACWINNVKAIQYLMTLLDNSINIKEFIDHKHVFFGLIKCFEHKRFEIMECVLDTLNGLKNIKHKNQSILAKSFWDTLVNNYSKKMTKLLISKDNWALAELGTSSMYALIENDSENNSKRKIWKLCIDKEPKYWLNKEFTYRNMTKHVISWLINFGRIKFVDELLTEYQEYIDFSTFDSSIYEDIINGMHYDHLALNVMEVFMLKGINFYAKSRKTLNDYNGKDLYNDFAYTMYSYRRSTQKFTFDVNIIKEYGKKHFYLRYHPSGSFVMYESFSGYLMYCYLRTWMTYDNFVKRLMPWIFNNCVSMTDMTVIVYHKLMNSTKAITKYELITNDNNMHKNNNRPYYIFIKAIESDRKKKQNLTEYLLNKLKITIPNGIIKFIVDYSSVNENQVRQCFDVSNDDGFQYDNESLITMTNHYR